MRLQVGERACNKSKRIPRSFGSVVLFNAEHSVVIESDFSKVERNFATHNFRNSNEEMIVPAVNRCCKV